MAITRVTSQNSVRLEDTAFSVATLNNVSSTFYLQNYNTLSFQCVIAGLTGTVEITIESSNDETNWDDCGASYTFSANGSHTFQIAPTAARAYRAKVTSAGSAGTCTTTSVGVGGN